MDDILINKFASTEKCIRRVRDEYTAIDMERLKYIIEHQVDELLVFGRILIALE